MNVYVKLDEVERVLDVYIPLSISEYSVRSYVREAIEQLRKCAIEVSEDCISRER